MLLFTSAMSESFLYTITKARWQRANICIDTICITTLEGMAVPNSNCAGREGMTSLSPDDLLMGVVVWINKAVIICLPCGS